MKYPIPKQQPYQTQTHGQTRIDNYHWMRDRGNPEVMAHLEAENAYCDQQLADTDGLEETLYQEMRSRINEDDESIHTAYKRFEYFSRQFAGKEYAVHYRVALEGGEETVLLDGNQEAEGKDFWDLGLFDISPSERLVAYAVDTKGDEYYDLVIQEIETQKILAELKQISASGLVFELDDSAVLYVRNNSMNRPYQVCRYDFGTQTEEVIFTKEDDRFFVSIQASKDEQTVFISCSSSETSDILWRDYSDLQGEWSRLISERQGHQYALVRYPGYWLIGSNRDEAFNQQLWKLELGKDFWKDAELLIPESKDEQIEDVHEFQDYIVIYSTGHATNLVDIYKLQPFEKVRLEFPESGRSISPIEVLDFASNSFRFCYTSLLQPQQYWEYNTLTNERTLLKESEVPNTDLTQYTQEQRSYTADDGTEILVTLMYQKEISLSAPLYLYGYGSYGITQLPYFSQTRLSLLDQGIIYALAHIRGGGEMGKYWHHRGRLLTKKNTFTDFITVAEGLIKDGVTSKEQLLACGGSAGGLLIGACMNLRPDLFRAVIADVPFVDVMNTMLDETLPLTITEYEEWGNPNDLEYYEYMNSYSPYENVREGVRYPVTLAIGGLHDPRVSYWEPTKWVAQLRDRVSNPEDIILKMYMTGHLGATGRYSYLREVAFRFGFVIRHLTNLQGRI